MTDEKRNRIMVAVTINLILLIVILSAVIVYQVVKITIISRNKKNITNRIEQLQQLTEKEHNNLEYWQSQAGLQDLAYQYGFVYGR